MSQKELISVKSLHSSRPSRIGFRKWILSLPVLFALNPMAMSADTEIPASIDYEVDPHWPSLPLPNGWTLGELAGLTVDTEDNVWVIQRPGTLFLYERAAAEDPPIAICCHPAPPVIQFDPDGNILRAWGGPGEGYDWPVSEHGITVDFQGNVWIGGNRRGDGMVLKFNQDGEFLMQIGGPGQADGSLDTTQLAGPADISVYEPTNEVLIADGYGNNRVIVFDAESGEFRRFWGAYGEPPTDHDIAPFDPDEPPSRQFRNVHCISVANDGLVYVCDRDSNRVQVFGLDGTFLHEWVYRAEHSLEGRGPGSVAHVAFWPDKNQSMILLTDSPNSQVRFINRATGVVLGEFGQFGNYVGQMNRLHQSDVDSKGNVFVAEAAGKRVQRFVPARRLSE